MISLNNCSTLKKVDNKLALLFSRVLNTDFKLDESKRNKALLGMEIGILPRELAEILFSVENEFSVEIPEDIINDGKFDTYNHILEVVCQLCCGDIK